MLSCWVWTWKLHGIWSKVTAPVCRDGCHENTPGTVGRVRNTRLALARPPGRSTEPQPQSGCNQLPEQSWKNTCLSTDMANLSCEEVTTAVITINILYLVTHQGSCVSWLNIQIHMLILHVSVGQVSSTRIQMVSGMLVSSESMMFCSSSCRPGVWNKSSWEKNIKNNFTKCLRCPINLTEEVYRLQPFSPDRRPWWRDGWPESTLPWGSLEVSPQHLFHPPSGSSPLTFPNEV